MRIARVEAVPLVASFADAYGGADRVPERILRPASHFLSVPRTGQYATLVTVTADDGTIGRGEAWGLPLPQLTALVVDRLIAPMAVGRDARDIDAIWRDVAGYFDRLGYNGGVYREALSGLDIALWDLKARRAGEPVAALLGPRVRDRIECYASPIMLCDTPEESGDAARALADAGYRAVKIKAGRGIETDIAHVAAARDAIGPDVDLMVDANGGYDRDGAIDFARELGPLGVTWLEEPVPPARIEDMKAVRDVGAVRIATGENDFDEWTFARIAALGAADVIMPNVSRAGGLTGCRRIAARCPDTEFSLHGVGTRLTQYASLHLMSVLPNARFFEVNLFPNPLRDQLAGPALTLDDGALVVPQGVGLGCRVDPDAVERFRAP